MLAGAAAPSFKKHFGSLCLTTKPVQPVVLKQSEQQWSYVGEGSGVYPVPLGRSLPPMS